MKVTRKEKDNLDDFVGITTSMLMIAGSFPALGGFSVAANATAAGFNFLYIALQRIGVVQIDKIKSLQEDFEEVIKNTFICTKKSFTTHSTKQLLRDVNSRIGYQVKQKQLNENTSLDDLYEATKEAVTKYYRSEKEEPRRK